MRFSNHTNTCVVAPNNVLLAHYALQKRRIYAISSLLLHVHPCGVAFKIIENPMILKA